MMRKDEGIELYNYSYEDLLDYESSLEERMWTLSDMDAKKAIDKKLQEIGMHIRNWEELEAQGYYCG